MLTGAALATIILLPVLCRRGRDRQRGVALPARHHDRLRGQIQEMRTTMAPNTIAHWINNKAYPGTGGNTAAVTNPATGEVTGQVALGSVEDAHAVIDAAAAAFPAWRDTSLAKRSAILFTFRELLNARKDEIAEIITAEHGKVLSDALGEVSRGQEVVEFACGMPQLLKGGFSESVSTESTCTRSVSRSALSAIISPVQLPCDGADVVLPHCHRGRQHGDPQAEREGPVGRTIAELWAEAGLPAGVFNVVHGDKVAVDGLLEHPDVKAISFVGSTPIARYVYETGTAHGKRVQALGGAKNHMVVLPDADLDLAADQRSTLGSVRPGSVAWPSRPLSRSNRRRRPGGQDRRADARPPTGDGAAARTWARWSRPHRDKVAGYVDAGVTEGATFVVDGREVSPTAKPTGSGSARPCSTTSRRT